MGLPGLALAPYKANFGSVTELLQWTAAAVLSEACEVCQCSASASAEPASASGSGATATGAGAASGVGSGDDSDGPGPSASGGTVTACRCALVIHHIVDVSISTMEGLNSQRVKVDAWTLVVVGTSMTGEGQAKLREAG
jgi:hypothetical protein